MDDRLVTENLATLTAAAMIYCCLVQTRGHSYGQHFSHMPLTGR